MEAKTLKNFFYNPNDLWLIDTDYSYDDQIAIYFLLKKINIIAITISQRIPKINQNLIKQKIKSDLTKYGKENIPIYLGADRPFINYVEDLKDDQILDPYNLKKINLSNFIENKSSETEINDFITNIAAVKIVELIKEHGKKLNIISLGPLTNLSLAVVLDHTIQDAFNNLFVVGGSIYNFGNSGNSSEFNFRVDPVAAKNVIANYKNITMISLEIDNKIKENRIIFLKNLEKLNLINIEILEFISDMKTIYGKTEDDENYYFSLFGFTAVLLILNPQLVKNMKSLPCDVDIFGRKTRGGIMIQNYDYLKNGKFNLINLISDFEFDGYLEELNKILSL